jgi:hypothetical protein
VEAEAEEIQMRGDLSIVTTVDAMAADAVEEIVEEDAMVAEGVVLGEDTVEAVEKEELPEPKFLTATTTTKSLNNLVPRGVLQYTRKEKNVTAGKESQDLLPHTLKPWNNTVLHSPIRHP